MTDSKSYNTDSDNTDQSAPAMFDEMAARSRFEESGEAAVDTIDQLSDQQQAAAEEADASQQQGRLSSDARRALINLLRHGVILAHNKQQLFDTLLKYRSLIQDHLADMFLRVLIDEQAGVAVLLQQDTDEDEDTVSLITRRPLSLYDTLLLLVLRKHFQERETAGDQRIYIDIDRIESRLTPFLPLTNNSRTDRRKLSSSLKNMKDRRLLQSVPGDDERFEITPVIRYVVNAEFLEQLLGEYQVLAAQTGKER